MKKPDFEKAKQYILDRLRTELDPRLSYHSIHHTEDYVVPSCELLAQHEGVHKEDKMLLLTAALYHDSGYIKQYRTNEPIAIEIASEILPGFGYNVQQIEIISDIILATALPQSPKTLLAEIMCDADLFHLGQGVFFNLSNDLRHELLAYGIKISEQKWYENTLVFLQTHKYFTQSANMLNNQKKEENIENIKEKIKKHETRSKS